ncbi:hypothetical protein L1765_04710 [Microaerobacter geothermalis]|uniref:hypothetical protein n=1 Tax=Microaerobacter geothermalis TaxID=674972 RepID=UPI001F30D86A|nr:hypothetical protein [Microaerobacter geothermalis]MCF6093296.1 hypothetical protein [Microaerobacter geothermalis]
MDALYPSYVDYKTGFSMRNQICPYDNHSYDEMAELGHCYDCPLFHQAACDLAFQAFH